MPWNRHERFLGFVGLPPSVATSHYSLVTVLSIHGIMKLVLTAALSDCQTVRNVRFEKRFKRRSEPATRGSGCRIESF